MGSRTTDTSVPAGHEAEALERARAEQQLWSEAAADLNKLDRGILALYRGVVEDSINQAYWKLRRKLYDAGLSQHQVSLLIRRHVHSITEPK